MKEGPFLGQQGFAWRSSTAMSVPERVGELDRRDSDVNLPLIWSISGLSVIQE
jgi:hypothetical protein